MDNRNFDYIDKNLAQIREKINNAANSSKFKISPVMIAAVKYADGDAFALQADLKQVSGVSVPAPIVGLEHRPILHKNVCEKTEIKDVVKNWLS